MARECYSIVQHPIYDLGSKDGKPHLLRTEFDDILLKQDRLELVYATYVIVIRYIQRNTV